MRTEHDRKHQCHQGSYFRKRPLFIFLILIFILVCSPLFVNIVNAGRETLITVNTTGTSQQVPAIWGDWIVWEDSRNGGFDIYGYNISSGEEKRITYSGKARIPAIYRNEVVWQDSRNSNQYDIYYYNLTNQTEIQITSETYEQSAPAIDSSNGTKIVWQEKQGSYYDIVLYEISTGTITTLTPGTSGSHQQNPAISGDLVVWEDYRNGGIANPDIFLYNSTSFQIFNLSIDPLKKRQITPSISRNRVVWLDMRGNLTGNIYINETYSGDWTTSQVDFPPATMANMFRPVISNDNIAWFEKRSSTSLYYDIFLKDLSLVDVETRITTDAAELVTTAPYSNSKTMGPAIYNNRIVWTDKRNDDTDIFLYTNDDNTPSCPIANFSSSVQSGPVPLIVSFTDNSDPNRDSITHRKWEFGEGSISPLRDPSFTYNSAGIYVVRLTVGNAACRNETPVTNKYNISVGIPFASFTTDANAGIVPLDIQFTDTSIGATQWNWTFGDGGVSGPIADPDVKNVIHSYNTPGTYTAILNASNNFGYATATKTIEVKNGAKLDSNPTITGIEISSVSGRQLLTIDKSDLPDSHIAGTALICTDSKLDGNGFQNITFLSNDGIGFSENPLNRIKGNISSVQLQSKLIAPLGFPKSIGEHSSASVTLTSPTYPIGGSVNTQMSEGASSDDRSNFDYIASKSNFNSIAGFAYTIQITKTGFPTGTTAKLNVSVNSSWVDQLGSDHLFMVRIADDGNSGEVLQTRLVATDTAANLDYYVVDSSRGASKFGLALLSGSGNPFQLITLTIASQANAPPPAGESDSYGTNGAPSGSTKGLSAQPPQIATEQKAPPAFIDPGKTAPLYANSVGVITQETTLTSTDTLASVVLGEGTIAKDSAGSPLSSISIASLAPDAIPAAPPSGQAVMIDGRSYELGPDGATFSPGISVMFTIPQAQWGKEYSLMMYDRTTGTWSEIPGSFNAKDGTFTAVLSHFCCVALFEKNTGQPAIRKTTQTPQPEPARLAPVETPTPQPPQNALSIVFSMAEWISGDAVHRSSYLTALAIICIIVLSIMLLHRRRNNP